VCHDGAYRLLVTELGLEVAFTAQKVPLIIELTQEGQYFEGLWKADCGELWLACPENGRYIELNLGANGAWWSCAFSSPRVRDLECRPPLCIEIKTEALGQYWQASLTLPWSEIFRCLQSEEAPVGNVTLVLGGCPDVDAPLENLHSAVPLGAVDFHRPQDWVPLSNLI
jgi:hypothetical protein